MLDLQEDLVLVQENLPSHLLFYPKVLEDVLLLLNWGVLLEVPLDVSLEFQCFRKLAKYNISCLKLVLEIGIESLPI